MHRIIRHAVLVAAVASASLVVATPASSATTGEVALSWAKTQIGKPYEYAAEGPDAYDCSGLTMRAYEQAGIALPRSSQAQYDATAEKRVPVSDLQEGDLLFYGSTASSIHHVGLFSHRNSVGEPIILDAQTWGVPVGYHDGMSYGDFYAATRPAGVSAPPEPKSAPAASTRLQGDFDGDGRADLAAFVESEPSVVQLWMWRSTSSDGPAMASKVRVWQGNGFNVARMRTMVGDVNGDGKTDIAALTDRGNGWTAVYVWRASGWPERMAVAEPVEVQVGAHEGWSTQTVRATMADLDRDGRDDLVAIAEYAERTVGIWAWRSTSSQGGEPTVTVSKRLWALEDWRISKMHVSAGDLDGDKRDDLVVYYDVGDNLVRGWYIRAVAGFDLTGKELIREGSDQGWSADTMQLLVADADGNGKDDVFVFVGVPGEEQLFAWHPTGEVGRAPDLGVKKLLWSDPDWDYYRLMPFAGDVNGDGNADVGAFYDFEGSGVRSWVWRATGSIGVDAPTLIHQTEGDAFATKTMNVA